MVDRFDQVENEYYRLKGRLAAGRITREQFENELKRLMIEDLQGRRWILGVDSGKWYVHDGQSWVEAQPRSDLRRDGIPRRSMLSIVAATSVLIVLCVGGLIAIHFGANESVVQRATGFTPTQTSVTMAIPPLTSTSMPSLTSTRPAIRRESPPSTAAPTATPTLTRLPSPTLRISSVTFTRTRTPTPPKSTVALASFGCPGVQGNRLFFDDYSNPQSGWTPYRGTD
ncbi:MAG: hypothetical protein HZB51_16065 [Chloroflexi bacterium]|nr:hypothetical protein [Chloroflexota bacterium]